MSRECSPSGPSAAGGPPSAPPGRLAWRCRRGMKELDVLLGRFLRERFAEASSADREAFAEFLELPDPQIAGYLLGGLEPPEPRLARIARLIATRSDP